MTVTLKSPYTNSPDAIWLKGNTHTHTTISDGGADPNEMIQRYAELGYDFLALTDHDVIGDLAEFDSRGLVLVRSVELCGGNPHIVHVNAKSVVNTSQDLQATIDAISADGGLAILCHPNWLQQYDHFTYDQLLSLQGYLGIEVFNGTCIDHPGSHVAIDKWDRLLSEGKHLWGLAADDAHALDQTGRGWVMVHAADKSVEAICDALAAGNFYSSSGVMIDEISCDGTILTVTSPDAQAIAVFGDYSRRLCQVDGGKLVFDATEVAGSYIRVECYGQANTSAWTQPIFVTGGSFDQRKQKFSALEATLAVGESSTSFLNMKDGAPPQVQTEVNCKIEDEKLVFNFHCQEPDMEALQLSVAADGDVRIYADDSIELFIDPAGRAAGYHHLMANASGYVYMQPYGSLPSLAGVQIEPGEIPGGWSLEISIPLDQLSGDASPGSQWGLHICRNRPASMENLIWSWTGPTNHAPARFGRLAFP